MGPPYRLHLRDLMTHRERHTPEEAPARDGPRTPPVRPSASASSAGTTSGGTGVPPVQTHDRRDAGPTGVMGDASLWMDWYHRASPAQQQEAVLRAIHQGIVYAHQLAAPAPS